MTCVICNSPTSQLFQKYGYWIHQCEVCHHRHAELPLVTDHVQRTYSDDYFQGGGAGYPDYLREGEMLVSRGKWYAQLLTRYMTPGTVLDVGAAAGFILKGFKESGWNGVGIEPNPNMAAYANKCLGVRVATCALEDFQSGEPYDLISMIQVIAHFYDLRKALQRAAEATRPGGFWLIETWNRESWTARILGKHWHEYSPPSVLHWFSLKDLQRVAAEFGFHPVAHGRPLKWISPAHAVSLLHYKLEDTALGRVFVRGGQLIPERLLIPYLADDLCWVLYKSDKVT